MRLRLYIEHERIADPEGRTFKLGAAESGFKESLATWSLHEGLNFEHTRFSTVSG
jgi:hypothetical protein